MSKLDESISLVAYVLDVLRAYREITDSGCCNDCACILNCEYTPELGQLTRYNCPHYIRVSAK